MDGGTATHITPEGALQTGDGAAAVLHRPLLYQNLPHGKNMVGGPQFQKAGGTIGFSFARYDPNLALVIDPTLNLIYSTYIGGVHDDISSGIALDAQNNIYIVGDSASQDYPVSGNAYQTTRQEIGVYSYDMVVTKFSPAGVLMYSTFLGGNGNDTSGSSQVLVDANGNAYFTGLTQSSNFPTTANAYQTTLPGGASQSAFLAEIGPDGSQLVYSTLFTGTGGSAGAQLAFNAQGKIYLTGNAGPGLPTTAVAYMPQLATGNAAFVALFDLTQTGAAQLAAATYYGTSSPASNSSGTGNDVFAVTVDHAGSVWIAGQAFTNNLPTTANALQPTIPALTSSCQGYGVPLNSAAFVAKLNAGLTSLTYASYLSGQTAGALVDDCSEFIRSLAVDANNELYLTGQTRQ